jgi:hypothetical protein
MAKPKPEVPAVVVPAVNGNGKRGRPKGYKPFVPALSSKIEEYRKKVNRDLQKNDWGFICREYVEFWKKVSTEEPPKCFIIAMNLPAPKNIEERIKNYEEKLKKLREQEKLQKSQK